MSEWQKIEIENMPFEAVTERESLKRQIAEFGDGEVVKTLLAYARVAPQQGSYAGSLWALAEWARTQIARTIDANGAKAMSEPTEQQVEAALRVWYPTANDATIVLLMKNGTGDLMRNVLSAAAPRQPTAQELVRQFNEWTPAAPRQASAMSAEADRIHVRLLAMGWLDHREDNCKTATEAAKLIRELSEESATRQAEGPNNAGAILVRLRYAILTATNDDLSEPGTEKRTRHIARIEAMHDAMEEIVSLCAAAGLTVGETIPQEEK